MRSEIPNPDGALKSEMFASFKIATGADELDPAVPSRALIREGENVASSGSKGADAVRRRAGEDRYASRRARCRFASGLKPGELIVARGAIFVDNEWRQ